MKSSAFPIAEAGPAYPAVVSFLCALCATLVFAAPRTEGAGIWQRLPVNQVRLHKDGEVGRRVDATIQSNLSVLKWDEDFIRPFVPGNRKPFAELTTGRQRFIGTGLTIDAAAKLAKYSGDPELIQRKARMIDAIVATQDSDGYIGNCKRGHVLTLDRRRKLWRFCGAWRAR